MISAACSFLQSIAETLVGGALLATVFFLVREKCFPLPEIEGRWFIETETIESKFNPYKGMILIHEAMLWREGNAIKGTAEKIHENSGGKQSDYDGARRTRSLVGGFVEKRYFGADRVCLHLTETGKERESSTIFKLTCKTGFSMSGTFIATAGSSSGRAHIRRERGAIISSQNSGLKTASHGSDPEILWWFRCLCWVGPWKGNDDDGQRGETVDRLEGAITHST